MDCRLAFSDVDRELILDGTARRKRIAGRGRQFRLVEPTPGTGRPNRRPVGHAGMILEGALEIDFDGEVQRFGMGDALQIPDGEAARRRPRAIGGPALMFLIEDEA